jgi:hypothetical protein
MTVSFRFFGGKKHKKANQRQRTNTGVKIMSTFADRMACQWGRIERAMKFANRNPEFRPLVEALINIYFDLIDEMAAELQRRRVTGTCACGVPSASHRPDV